MNDIQGLAEVSEALSIAWKVYEQGWIREHAPNPQLAKFGEEVQTIADNLSNVVRIVENARICYQQQAIRSPMFRGFFVQKQWDLTSLHEICGGFKATVTECEALLAQNRDGYRSEASAYGDEWLLVMKPKVDELCTRLRAHNAKLSMILKPLETKLLGDVHQEFIANQPPTQQMRQAMPNFSIQGLMVVNLEQTLAEYRQVQPAHIDMPPDVDAQLRTQVAESRPELRYPGAMKLQAGVDMFAEFFDGSTKRFVPGNFVSERQPSAQQYLNLARANIVVQHMQQSQELRQVLPSSLWPLFIAEVMNTMRAESLRFSSRTADRLLPPDFNSLQRALRGPQVGIGSREDVSKLMSPHFETYSKPIFNVPLPNPQEGLQRQLSISRIDSTKLRLIEAVHEQNNPAAALGEIVMDIDLSTIQFAPIYATPSSRPRPLEVLLQTQLGQLNPTFCEAKHIYRLQHLLTGYKVYDKYDQAMVKVSFFVTGQSSPLEEHGRVQLWLPQPYGTADRSGVATPSQTSGTASASVLHDPPVVSQQQVPKPAVERTSSFRKWIPGLRKNSATSSSDGASPGASNRSRSSSTTSHTSQAAPSPVSNMPPLSSGRPVTNSFGPFELSAADQSPHLATGLSPVHATHQQSYGYSSFERRAPPTPNYLPSPRQSPVYQPYGMDDLPEIAQQHRPDTTQQTTGWNHSQAYPHPVAPQQQAWPYSPDSISPASAPPWAEQHTIQNEREPYQSTNTTTPSIQTERKKPASTIRPSQLYPQSSPSVISTRSTRSHSSMASSVTTIRTSTGTSSVSSSGVARMHHKPQKPLLVIFLKSRDPSAKLSIVAIQIDSNTSVVRERCDCYNSHSTCRISCVERSSGGGLLAQRWEADAGLTSFNAAKLGEHQRKDSQNGWPNLKRVSLRFEKMEGK
jgi:hypothetical protein